MILISQALPGSIAFQGVVVNAVRNFPENAKLLENGFSFLWTCSQGGKISREDGISLVFLGLQNHATAASVHRQALGFLRALLTGADVQVQRHFMEVNGLKVAAHLTCAFLAILFSPSRLWFAVGYLLPSPRRLTRLSLSYVAWIRICEVL